MTNTEHVKSIAHDIEFVYNGTMWICPECGKMFESHSMDDVCECPDCGAESERMGFYEYFDTVYDIEYRVESKHADHIKSVRLCVAFGGPNIYIDTADNKVKLYWWGDYVEYEFSRDAGNEIEEMFDEIWNC